MLKPIIFNTEMVQAILEGRKTVTRRIADINDEITCYDGTTNHDFVLDNFAGGTPTGFVCRKCGFGVAPPHSRVPCGTSLFRPRYWPGDVLYVRETWRIQSAHRFEADAKIEFKAGGPMTTIQFDGRCSDSHERKDYDSFISKWWNAARHWRPSIFMPKDAARIFLRVTHVRVERLQDITADECPMEGVWPLAAGPVGGREAYYKNAFAKLWDSTIPKHPNKFKSYPHYWANNPWVWVTKFERCEKPEELTHV